MTPGEYVLQVIVSDILAGDIYSVGSRWIDFQNHALVIQGFDAVRFT